MLVFITFAVAQNQQGDWADHSTGHELFVTLSNEMDTLFVILWFKDMLNNPKQLEVNDRARRELDSLIQTSHPGAVYTEVDMSNANRNAYTYERLASKNLGVNLRELEYGPVAVIIKNGVGQQVVFKGNYQDFMDKTDSVIHEVNIENEQDIDAVTSRQQALDLAKQKQLTKTNKNFDYYRPGQYDRHEFQAEDRYGYWKDPTYNESPVAVGSGSKI